MLTGERIDLISDQFADAAQFLVTIGIFFAAFHDHAAVRNRSF